MKRAVIGLLSCFLLAACAPTDLVFRPDYRPVVAGGRGSGPLVVVSPVATAAKPEGAVRVPFVYGEVKDTGGKIKGNVVSQVAPLALVQSALQQELTAAGYSVQLNSAVPKGADRVLVLTAASVTLDEVTSLVKISAECKVQLTLELWQKGSLVSRLTYGKNIADFAVRDREKLHQQLLQKTLGAVMTAVVADLEVYFK